jgi:hypothetical protein
LQFFKTQGASGNLPADTLQVTGFGSFAASNFNSASTVTAASGLFRLASTEAVSWRNNANGADVALSKTGAASGSIPADTLNATAFGGVQAATYITASNCTSSAAPAVCGSAAAGSVVIAAGSTTVTVNTTAVTANSQIFVQEDDSLGTKLSVTCNTGVNGNLAEVTARTAGTSFVLTTSPAPNTNPACYSYFIVN